MPYLQGVSSENGKKKTAHVDLQPQKCHFVLWRASRKCHFVV